MTLTFRRSAAATLAGAAVVVVVVAGCNEGVAPSTQLNPASDHSAEPMQSSPPPKHLPTRTRTLPVDPPDSSPRCGYVGDPLCAPLTVPYPSFNNYKW
jgi:hypothetical protein